MKMRKKMPESISNAVKKAIVARAAENAVFAKNDAQTLGLVGPYCWGRIHTNFHLKKTRCWHKKSQSLPAYPLGHTGTLNLRMHASMDWRLVKRACPSYQQKQSLESWADTAQFEENRENQATSYYRRQ